MSDGADVVIVGGGVVGASAAYHLAATGAGVVVLLDRAEAAAIAPGIALDGVIGASFCPDDGIADPAGLTEGYATVARRAGAEIRLGVDVVAIEMAGDHVTGVRTADGIVESPIVIDAAGPWAGALAATIGVELPLEPIPRMVVTTGPFPGSPTRRTLVIDAGTSYYFHKEGDGVLMGMGGRDERASFSTDVDH